MTLYRRCEDAIRISLMETGTNERFLSGGVTNGDPESTDSTETLNKKRSMEEDDEDDDLPPPLVEFQDAISKRIPVSILTGFLGSGKKIIDRIEEIPLEHLNFFPRKDHPVELFVEGSTWKENCNY